MPVQNRTMIDAGLKKIGFGGLDDPTLFDQIAFVISGKGEKEGHVRFKSLLLSALPEQRLIAYQSIAPKLRFKAFPLEDYIRQGREDADRLHLPTYNRETLAIDEWHKQEIETQEYKRAHEVNRFVCPQCGDTFEEGPGEPADCCVGGHWTPHSSDAVPREIIPGFPAKCCHEYQRKVQTDLEKFAQKAIAKDLREENAKGQLVLVCRKCTREGKWRGKRRQNMMKIARLDGWSVVGGILCPACKKCH